MFKVTNIRYLDDFSKYLFHRSEVPWASCDNEWNTPHCYSITHENNQSFIDNQTHPSAFEYF
jgi:hypothetical protein